MTVDTSDAAAAGVQLFDDGKPFLSLQCRPALVSRRQFVILSRCLFDSMEQLGLAILTIFSIFLLWQNMWATAPLMGIPSHPLL